MDKQGIAAIALLLVGYLLYQFLYMHPAQVKYQEQYREWALAKQARDGDGTAPVTTRDGAEPAPVTTRDGAPAPVTTDGPPPAPPPPPSAPPDERIAFQTAEHDVVLSTAGASLSELTFRTILGSTHSPVQEGEDDARPRTLFEPLHPYLDDVRSLALVPLDRELAFVATTHWAHEALAGGAHRFTLRLPGGLLLSKTYVPTTEAGLFHFDLVVRVENPTAAPLRFGYRLNGPAGMVEETMGGASVGQQAVMALRERNRVRLETLAVTECAALDRPDKVLEGDVSFFGLATKYFAAVVIPDPARPELVARAEAQGLLQSTGGTPSDRQRAAPDGLGHQGLVRGWVAEAPIAAGGFREDRYRVYVGPRQKAVFEDPSRPYHGLGLEQLVDFGWFEWLARILLAVLFALHGLLGNWGLAVIFLTFIVRGLLLPLTTWSQKNMLRMQKLAPELNKLKERFTRKDGSMTPDAQREFAAAQMELFRKHRVNPIGCIGPIFLQMPVFIGLWNALNWSYELRQTEFALWVTDLSVPDVLFRLPFTLPFVGTNAFSVLPLLMVGTMLLSNELQPMPTDPRAQEQRRMMRFMMPVFGFLFYAQPSGLLLYFVTSSLWGIVEQKVIRRRFEAVEGPLPSSAALPPSM